MQALLIDGLNLIRRIFAGVPGDESSNDHTEAVVNAVSGSINRALNDFNPTHAVCVFDGAGPTWRHTLFPDYKRERPPMPSALVDAMSLIKSRIQAADIACLSVPGYEADDILASMAVRIAAHDGQCIVLSTDTSFCQLLTFGIRVRDHFSSRDLDRRFVQEKFGVKPSQLSDWLAMVGNASLGIAGVKGIGKKTAAKLLNEFEDLETILNNAEQILGRTGELLSAGADEARFALQLVRLKTDIDLGLNLKQFRHVRAEQAH